MKYNELMDCALAVMGMQLDHRMEESREFKPSWLLRIIGGWKRMLRDCSLGVLLLCFICEYAVKLNLNCLTTKSM
ncbi:hypothetical protein ACFX13_047041 [Malus domestica]